MMDGFIRPQNLQSFQNGNYNDDTFDLFSNVSNNEIAQWDLNSMNHEPDAQVTASHLNWQQPPVISSALDSYGRPFSKSPSVIQPTPTYGYGDPRQFVSSPYDPALVPPLQPNTTSTFPGHSPYAQQPVQHGTIAPQALQHGQPPSSRLNNDAEAFGSIRKTSALNADHVRTVSSIPNVDQAALCAVIPRGDLIGRFAIVDRGRLEAVANTRKIAAYVDVAQNELEYPINKALVQTPARRKSRNELIEIAKSDPRLLAKLGKKHSKKTSSSTQGGLLQRTGAPARRGQSTPGIKYEGDSSSEEYSSSSEDDSDDYSEDELSEPSPLPAKRPETPLEAVKYDSMKATWRSKRFNVDAAEIRSALKEFWEVVRTIRDRWKTDTAAVTEAEDKKRIGELPLLRSRVKDQRDMFEAALKAALQHGHRTILEQFSVNVSFLYLLYQFLVDRFKDEDYDGPLTRAILEILAMCSTLSEENLEKTRLGKVYPRFAKKGGPETQALVKRIDVKVAEYKQKKSESSQTQSPAEIKAEVPAVVKPSPTGRPPPERVAGVKRAAPLGDFSDQNSKRQAPGPATSANAAVNHKPSVAVKKPGVPSVPSKMPSSVPAAAAKAKPANPRQPGGATTTGAGVKKSVKAVTPSLVANALKTIEKKTAGPSAAAAPAKPAFSFAETMANLTKPKQKEPTPKEEEIKRVPETAEEKRKRLRKEERRKLRVTFKPDNQLVEVRLFHHDVDEELGHEANMIRDVSDVGGEGRMFKQHKDMDVDDDDEPGEENVRPYTELTLTDFSDVDADERKRNYSPYGGGELQPQTTERAKREQYEANTLMAYDNPPCPREPADPYDGEPIVTKDFGRPDPQGVAATRAARFTGLPSQTQQPGIIPTPDISAILALINPQHQSQQPQQALQPSASNPLSVAPQAPDQMSEIQRILASLPQASSQAQQPPGPSQVSHSTVSPDVTSVLASFQQQPNLVSMAPTTQQTSQTTLDANIAADTPNLAAILSQLNGQSGAAGASNLAIHGQFPFYNPNFNVQGLNQMQQPEITHENEERRRWRDGDEDDSGSQGRKWGGKKGKEKHYTLPCKYWKQGKCMKGSNCTYKHE